MHEDQHQRELVVWDVPAGIACGESFTIQVGSKCLSACQPANWRIAVRDQEQTLVATSLIGNSPWPGTAGLFYAQIGLRAPQRIGIFDWEVTALPVAAIGADAESGVAPGASAVTAAHPVVRAALRIRTEPAAECRLTVIAVDRDSQAPVPGARVVVHPYCARTDEQGIAELRLPGGPFRLFVSGPDRFPFRRDGELSGDLSIRAELLPDREPGEAELWS